jgi:hypothetical protein
MPSLFVVFHRLDAVGISEATEHSKALGDFHMPPWTLKQKHKIIISVIDILYNVSFGNQDEWMRVRSSIF